MEKKPIYFTKLKWWNISIDFFSLIYFLLLGHYRNLRWFSSISSLIMCQEWFKFIKVFSTFITCNFRAKKKREIPCQIGISCKLKSYHFRHEIDKRHVKDKHLMPFKEKEWRASMLYCMHIFFLVWHSIVSLKYIQINTWKWMLFHLSNNIFFSSFLFFSLSV